MTCIFHVVTTVLRAAVIVKSPHPPLITVIMDVLRKRLSMWSPPPWCWMTHDGLCRLRIIFKSASCVKLTCVINTDLVPISYVNGSRYLVVVMHEVEVIISMVSEALRRDVYFALCLAPDKSSWIHELVGRLVQRPVRVTGRLQVCARAGMGPLAHTMGTCYSH